MAFSFIKSSPGLKRWIQRVRWFSIVVIIATGSLYFVFIPYDLRQRIRTLKDALVTKYGIIVKFDDPAQFYIPPLKRIDDGNNITIKQVDKQYVPEVLEGAVNALNLYPPDFVKKYLSAIFIAGKITIYDVEGAATFANSWIFISAPSAEAGRTVDYEKSVHHEFSSLVFYNAQFPVIEWHLVNPPAFKYLEKHEDVIRAADRKNRKKPRLAEQWYEAGFVSDYGMSDMENDFNTYAEMAMSEPEELKALSAKYQPIKRKTHLLVEFYTRLAPQMCDYFKKEGLTDVDCQPNSKTKGASVQSPEEGKHLNNVSREKNG